MAKRIKVTKRPGIPGNRKPQTFVFALPAPKSVQLVGDFTQWQDKPINMQKAPDVVWRTTVQLAPGPQYYRFLVDGQSQDDLQCTLHVPNPFGSQDCVCQVG
jgi:1,4-alpha-glucan branching enzyme